MDKTDLIKMAARGDETLLTINWKLPSDEIISMKDVTAGDILKVEKKLKALGHTETEIWERVFINFTNIH